MSSHDPSDDRSKSGRRGQTAEREDAQRYTEPRRDLGPTERLWRRFFHETDHDRGFYRVTR